MCKASTCWRVRARARVQVLQNSASWLVVLRFTTLSARDCHSATDEIKEKKLYRVQQYNKPEYQCIDGLSATQNGRGAAKGFSTHQDKPISPDSLQPVLTTKP